MSTRVLPDVAADTAWSRYVDGQRGQATAQFVGAVPTQLTLVTIFELLLAAASLAVFLDARVERFDLGCMARCEWFGGGVDQSEQLRGEPHRHRTGAVELFGCFDEGLAPFGQRRIGGEHPCAVEVAERGLRRNHGSGRIDAFGQQARRDHVGTDRPEVDACAP